jgi:hypothetical protein
MIKDTWVSVDLDYWAPLSWKRGKRISFDRFLKSIPNNIRCFLTIEHHEVLRPLRKAIKEGDLSLPMNIIHVDTHHDYYFNIARGKKIDCGNFMWKIPQKWYKQFRWYQPHFPEEWDWEKAQEKLKNKTKVCNEKPKINWSRVGLITFTLSPDYCEELIYKAEKMIEAITKKFNLNRTIEKRDAKSDNSVESWGYKLLKG